jgi:hypothetical protein
MHSHKQESDVIQIVSLATKLLELYQWQESSIDQAKVISIINDIQTALEDLKASLG